MLALPGTVILALMLCGCGRPGISQLQSDVTAAAGRIGPVSDPQQIATHRTNVSQAVTQALQSATAADRAALLQHCRTLVAEEFAQTYQFSTIAEPESLHFTGTLGGLHEAIWPTDKSWSDQCLLDLLPTAQLQQQWLESGDESVSSVQNVLRGLQLSHAELLKISGRAVSAATLQQLVENLLDVAFRSQQATLRSAIVGGLLENFGADRALIARCLDQRLQKSADPLSVDLYERYSAQLQLSVPLAVLRRQLQAAAAGNDTSVLLGEIAVYKSRAEQLAVSADAVLTEAVQTAAQRPLAGWAGSDTETETLAELLAGLSTKTPQHSAWLQQQIDMSMSSQLQLALATGDESRLRDVLKRAVRLGLTPERQVVLMEQLTSADTADSSRQRLLYAAITDQSTERVRLINSVLTRKTLTDVLLHSALSSPFSPGEWSLIRETLQQHLPMTEIPPDRLFATSLDLPADGPRMLLLGESVRRQPLSAGRLQVLAEAKLTEEEAEELQRIQQSARDSNPSQPTEAISVESAVSLLRMAPNPGFARLVLSRTAPQAAFSLPQLRQLLSPQPVAGIEDFLRMVAGQALEVAAREPAEPAFTEALEFYERYRESLKLTATPGLIQAAFENALSRKDPASVLASLRELVQRPELLTPQNSQRLQEFALSRLKLHAERKQAVAADTLDLLTTVKAHFPAAVESIAGGWQELLLQTDRGSETLKKDTQAAVKVGLADPQQLAGTMLGGLRTTFADPKSEAEFRGYREQMLQLRHLFQDFEVVGSLLQAEEDRWKMLLLARVQALQQDYEGLTGLFPLLQEAAAEVDVATASVRLLELAPLEDSAAIVRDAERYLQQAVNDPAQASPAASRRLLRFAVSKRNWPLAEQQLQRVKSAGPLDATEQAADSRLQNVFFGLQLARSWQNRRIPMNIVRTYQGRRGQINIDLKLQEVRGEDVSGTTAIENTVDLGAFTGRIGENGLELTLTGESLNLDASQGYSVTLNPASVRDRYDDVEFSGMNRGARLLVGELPDGDIVFVDLPPRVIPLKPRWEGLSEYGERRWFLPPALDENGRLYFQTAVFRNLGIQGHRLTLSVADLTKQGAVKIRGDLLYFTGTATPKTLQPHVRILRDAELTPFATQTVQLRPNTGQNTDLGRHFGRQPIDLEIPRDVRLVILEADMLPASAVWFNGMSLELPAAAVPVKK